MARLQSSPKKPARQPIAAEVRKTSVFKRSLSDKENALPQEAISEPGPAPCPLESSFHQTAYKTRTPTWTHSRAGAGRHDRSSSELPPKSKASMTTVFEPFTVDVQIPSVGQTLTPAGNASSLPRPTAHRRSPRMANRELQGLAPVYSGQPEKLTYLDADAPEMTLQRPARKDSVPFLAKAQIGISSRLLRDSPAAGSFFAVNGGQDGGDKDRFVSSLSLPNLLGHKEHSRIDKEDCENQSNIPRKPVASRPSMSSNAVGVSHSLYPNIHGHKLDTERPCSPLASYLPLPRSVLSSIGAGDGQTRNPRGNTHGLLRRQVTDAGNTPRMSRKDRQSGIPRPSQRFSPSMTRMPVNVQPRPGAASGPHAIDSVRLVDGRQEVWPAENVPSNRSKPHSREQSQQPSGTQSIQSSSEESRARPRLRLDTQIGVTSNRYSVHSLPGCSREYGPTLKIHESAHRVLLGESEDSNDEETKAQPGRSTPKGPNVPRWEYNASYLEKIKGSPEAPSPKVNQILGLWESPTALPRMPYTSCPRFDERGDAKEFLEGSTEDHVSQECVQSMARDADTCMSHFSDHTSDDSSDASIPLPSADTRFAISPADKAIRTLGMSAFNTNPMDSVSAHHRSSSVKQAEQLHQELIISSGTYPHDGLVDAGPISAGLHDRNIHRIHDPFVEDSIDKENRATDFMTSNDSNATLSSPNSPSLEEMQVVPTMSSITGEGAWISPRKGKNTNDRPDTTKPLNDQCENVVDSGVSGFSHDTDISNATRKFDQTYEDYVSRLTTAETQTPQRLSPSNAVQVFPTRSSSRTPLSSLPPSVHRSLINGQSNGSPLGLASNNPGPLAHALSLRAESSQAPSSPSSHRLPRSTTRASLHASNVGNLKSESAKQPSAANYARSRRGVLSKMQDIFYKRNVRPPPSTEAISNSTGPCAPDSPRTRGRAQLEAMRKCAAGASGLPHISEVPSAYRPRRSRSSAQTPSSGNRAQLVASRSMLQVSKPVFQSSSNAATSDTQLDKAFATASEILRKACDEPSDSPRKVKLIEMGKVLVEAVTQARDAFAAVEEAKMAAHRAEMAHAFCLQAVRRTTTRVAEWAAFEGV